MPNTDVTPTPASTSSLFNEAADTVISRFGQMVVTTTQVSTFVVGAASHSFDHTQLYTSKYAAPVVSTSVYGSGVNTFTVTREAYSAPITLFNVTQYHNIVTTNTTVWNSFGTPSSLLLAAPGSGDDVVSYKVAVVVDTVV